MPGKKSVPKPGTVDIAKAGFAKLSAEEQAKLTKAITIAVTERDLRTFRAALLKLGFDETSAQYEKMMKLWDEHSRASRP